MLWSEELDRRIEEVTVDAFGEAEQLGAFACVLDELLALVDVSMEPASDAELALALAAYRHWLGDGPG